MTPNFNSVLKCMEVMRIASLLLSTCKCKIEIMVIRFLFINWYNNFGVCDHFEVFVVSLAIGDRWLQ